MGGVVRHLGLKTDGTLWGWGENGMGQLGQNNKTHYSSPVQIPGTTWTNKFHSGYSAVAAVKSDGTLWTWGNGNLGKLGQNTPANVDRSSPTQVPGTTWDTVEGNGQTGSMYARKTDGTAWTWGANNYGDLGQNNTTDYSSPVQIPGTTWSQMRVGHRGGGGRKTDGTLWLWGWTHSGGLGQKNVTQYSSPTQIPGTTWRSAKCGPTFTIATKTDNTLWMWGENNLSLIHI